MSDSGDPKQDKQRETDEEREYYATSDDVEAQIEELFRLVRDAGALDDNMGGEKWEASDLAITKAVAKMKRLLIRERRLGCSQCAEAHTALGHEADNLSAEKEN